VTVGRRRWPMVEWRLGRIEEILSEIEPFDLMLVAQALQWFDRPRFYQGCRARLVLGGVLAILQNNRDWKASEFLDEYEALLEETSPGYTRHYRSFDVEAELAGLPWGAGEPIIDKPGKGGFYATNLEMILVGRGIRNLVFTGVTSDCCVHTTMTNANDKGYECLILEDCSAALDQRNHTMIMAITAKRAAQFGAVAPAARRPANANPSTLRRTILGTLIFLSPEEDYP